MIKTGKKNRKWEKGKGLQGSMTVEMSFLMPMILFLIMGCILAVFYYHDKNVISSAAYETAVVGSTKMRERDQVEESTLQALYRERIRKKCILFPTGNAQIQIEKEKIEVTAAARKGKFRVKIRKCAAVTEPEKKIRKKLKVEELVNGTKNND